MAEHRRGSHKAGRLKEPIHIAGPAGALLAVVDRHSGKDLLGQQSLVHGQLQQTFAIDARQDTIASGSCCDSPREGSRSFAGYRTESLDVAEHSKAGRFG